MTTAATTRKRSPGAPRAPRARRPTLYYSADGLTSWPANESFRHPPEKPVDGGAGGSGFELLQRMQTLLRNNISCVVRDAFGRRILPTPTRNYK